MLGGVVWGPASLQGQPESAGLIADPLSASIARDSVVEPLSQITSAPESLEEALDANQEALVMAGSDPSKQAWLWVERAVLYARTERMAEARRAIAAARAIAETTGVHLFEEKVLLRTGMRLFELELFEDAARCLEEAVKLLKRPDLDDGGRSLLETAHYYLVLSYGSLGFDDMQRAKMIELEQVVEDSRHLELLRFAEFFLASKSAMESLASKSAVESGAVDIELKQYLDASRRLIEATRNSENRDWQRTGQQLEAFLAVFEPIFQMDDDSEMVEYLLQQTDVPGVGKIPELGVFVTLFAPAFEHIRDGREEEAFNAFGRRLQQLRSIPGYRPTQLQEVQGLMASAMAEGLFVEEPPVEAVDKTKEAIALFESYVDGMRVEEAMAGLIDETGHEFYQVAVEILARVDPEQAFFYAEKGRAWTLRRLLASPRRSIPETDSAEQEILAEVSTLERDQRTNPGTEEARLPTGELESRREEFGVKRLQHKLSVGSGTTMAPVEPVTLDQLRHKVLAPDSTLLAYFPGFRKPGLPQLWVWAVDRDGIEMTSIPMPEERWHDVACQVQALRWQDSPPAALRAAEVRGARLLSGCHAEDDPAAALYRLLIAPIAPHLRQRNLIVVPHGLLHHLPFAALRDPETGRYLVQDFTLSLAPSASALELLSQRREPSAEEALVLGDPVTHLGPLAGAHEEAETVADLLGSSPFLGEQASESCVYENAGRIRLLHLAAHGQYVPQSPLFSRILLSADSEHDGALEMHEVLDDLDLRGTELVVLSGCETALGEITRGDEIIGLTRAFLVAGSQTVISTLWPVEDAASAQLMKRFYARYLNGGATAAEALRSAQLEMLAQANTAAPYYWAGFTLTGRREGRWHSAPTDISLANTGASAGSTSAPSAERPSDPTFGLPPTPSPAPTSRPGAPPLYQAGASDVRHPFSSRDETPAKTDQGVGPQGTAQTTGERLAGLDHKLEDSLAEFDGMLLREKEVLAARRTGSSGGASGAGARETESTSGDGADTDRQASDSSGSEDGERVGEKLKKVNPNGRIPPDIPDGNDDDIVARQLREAAMEEEDPELRERLWQEYRDYKNGQAKSDGSKDKGKNSVENEERRAPSDAG